MQRLVSDTNGASGPAVFAVCPEQQLIAYVQRGSEAAIKLVGAADLQSVVTFKEPSKSEWLHLSITAGGNRILSLGGLDSLSWAWRGCI